MNKIQLTSLLSFFLCLLASCNGMKKDKTNIGSVEILYFKGHVETNVRIHCGVLTKTKSSFMMGDTTLIEKYKEITSQVGFLKELKVDSTTSCDVRIQCKINCENGDSIKLCIGKFNCLIKNGKGMEKNDSLIYLIRRYSGYYNYFSKEELTDFDELKQFGLPNDYKDLRRINKPNSIPLPPR